MSVTTTTLPPFAISPLHSEGDLVCEPVSLVVFETGGRRYAVNGAAKGAGYPSIEPIGEMLHHGLALLLSNAFLR